MNNKEGKLMGAVDNPVGSPDRNELPLCPECKKLCLIGNYCSNCGTEL